MRKEMPRLLAITDRRLCGGEEKLLVACEALLEQGLPALMLREKDLGARALYNLAQPLREMTKKHKALLIINDRADVAFAVEADGIHLGSTALPAEVVKRLCHPGFMVGVSCHSRMDLLQAERDGADYALLSPIYNPLSKESRLPPLGEEGFRSASEEIGIPVLALGGISGWNVRAVMEAGAYGVASIGGFFSDDPTELLAHFR